jgi:hypothetical protein
MPAKDYLSKIVARVLDQQRSRKTENLDQHLADMAARIAKETTPAEMKPPLKRRSRTFGRIAPGNLENRSRFQYSLSRQSSRVTARAGPRSFADHCGRSRRSRYLDRDSG